MENCVEITNYNLRRLVTIKSPGSVRSPQGKAIAKIEMTVPDAVFLFDQLKVALTKELGWEEK